VVKNSYFPDLELIGGRLCLDFINTVSTRKASPPQEYLQEPIDIAKWAVKVGALDARELTPLIKFMEREPMEAARFLEKACSLREDLYRIFLGVVAESPTDHRALDRLNKNLGAHFEGLRLEATAGKFHREWAFPNGDTRMITAPILFDAWELLQSDHLSRVKECPNCGWVFLDRTRNGSRRWCSMQACGSGVKALDWYYRNKKK
jgi:predicted RNA-binding Zn ribbon-like protein